MTKIRAFTAFSLVALAACSSTGPNGGEQVGRAKQAVIKGTPSDASQDAVVLLVHLDLKNPSGVGQCTGTLLAPRLVLTARHCVAESDASSACDADGKPLAEGVVRRNHDPATMFVFTGKDRPVFHSARDFKPAGKGLEIVDTGAKNLCNSDIALLVLEEPIEGAAIAPIRLDSDVTKGEVITAIGWGVTDRTPQPDVRQQRTGISITEVGPREAGPREMPIPPNEFEVGESICSGDSGGPGIAEETGAIVGVVSRGGRPGRQESENPAADCIKGENFYTKTSPFKEMVLGAFELAEAEPWIEGKPDPRKLKTNALCADPSECRSNICLGDPGQGGKTACAEDCSSTPCADGLSCESESGYKVCRVPDKSGLSCASTPSSPASGTGVLFALAALALACFRRRR